MKKIFFSLVAFVAAMSMNAQVMTQVMKVYKDGAVVASYTTAQMDSVVFEEEPAVQPYSVTFEKGEPDFDETDFAGWYSSTLTASNADVSVSLALIGDMDPEWNAMGDVHVRRDAKLTITVTPAPGVTVTGIEYIHNFGNDKVIKTGAGPWEFDVKAADRKVYDGSTPLGKFYGIVVNYTK